MARLRRAARAFRATGRRVRAAARALAGANTRTPRPGICHCGASPSTATPSRLFPWGARPTRSGHGLRRGYVWVRETVNEAIGPFSRARRSIPGEPASTGDEQKTRRAHTPDWVRVPAFPGPWFGLGKGVEPEARIREQPMESQRAGDHRSLSIGVPPSHAGFFPHREVGWGWRAAGRRGRADSGLAGPHRRVAGAAQDGQRRVAGEGRVPVREPAAPEDGAPRGDDPPGVGAVGAEAHRGPVGRRRVRPLDLSAPSSAGAASRRTPRCPPGHRLTGRRA
jgi:hypothetical protein